jgi:hypothetical protein
MPLKSDTLANLNGQLQVAAAVANQVHDTVDKVIALHDQAGAQCPWLQKARQAFSEAVGHLGSHAASPAVSQSNGPSDAR